MRAGLDDHFFFIQIFHAALHDAWWAEYGGDEISAAGDGVELARGDDDEALDALADRAVVFADFQLELVVGVLRIEDDGGVVAAEDLADGGKIGRFGHR